MIDILIKQTREVRALEMKGLFESLIALITCKWTPNYKCHTSLSFTSMLKLNRWVFFLGNQENFKETIFSNLIDAKINMSHLKT